MGKTSLLLAISLVFLSACELQNLMNGGKPGGGRDSSGASVTKEAPDPEVAPIEHGGSENNSEVQGEESLEDVYELARRFERVAQVVSSRSAIESEIRRLEYLPRFELLTDAYNFARDTRYLGTDAERNAFANAMATQGVKFYAVYKYVYAFAKETRRLPSEAERHAFAVARSQTALPIQDATLLVHSYALAQELRHLSSDAERMAMSTWIEEKAKSLRYMGFYEDAYVYARDVRRLPTEAERHLFATQEADRDAQ